MGIRNIIILGLCLFAVCSCGGGSGLDARFKEIDRLCDSIPEVAIDSLASIDQTGLSEKDLNRYRLLHIKSRDKAYIAHTSDTLILDLVDYYDRHRNEGLYPEALYYGGRVYSDLGDYPTALEFFQKSLDEIPEDDAYLSFKSTVLNQTGRLLHTLRLESAAIDYLEKSLHIDSTIDRIDNGIAFTHGLLSSAYRNINDVNKARKHMNIAMRLSSDLPPDDRYTIKTEFATMLLHAGSIDSALNVIRILPSLVDSITIPYCLAAASEIYREAGILDTAYMYARQLTLLNTPYNKRTGYKVIFSDRMSHHVPKDTLLRLMPEYKRSVEEYLDQNEADQVIMQNSRFNYLTHVKKREKAERESRGYRNVLLATGSIIIILLLLAVIVFIFRKFIKVRRESDFMEILNISESLKTETNQSKYNICEDAAFNESTTDKEKDYAEIKKTLLDRMSALKNNKIDSLIEEGIVNSEILEELKDKIKNEKCIADSENTWNRIEELIETVSPGFNKRLVMLTEGNITPSERKVAMLMKCGITPTNISKLLARGRNTISSQRRSLANKISEDKIDLDSLDKLIITL
ncbi:MAG: tetratricopeptide repeat protein [Muribaculaceae bacterium]|nr:tetratricopeptide repeat protein [Muribaculaceae bacterium]